MGKVSKLRYITRDEDLPVLKAGPISILMGANLRRPRTLQEDQTQKPDGDEDQVEHEEDKS
jgi:hypothetical protein